MKILVIALSGIGDALMFTPAIVKLSEEWPDAQIDALVMYKGVKDIYEKLPQITRIRFFDFLNSKKIDSLFFVLSLRHKYDAVINVYPSNRKEYNLISRLIGSQKRIAVEYLRGDKKNWGKLNNIRVKENDSLHNVEENIRMVKKLIEKKIDEIPPLQFNLNNEDLEYGNLFCREKSISQNDLVIGFHAGCSPLKNHDKRRWEPPKFAELAKRLIEKQNAKILLFGGVEENHIKNIIIANAGSQSVMSVQTFSLSNTAAVMKRCNLFVTNDSSLMHVAAALKLNVVAIIGPTNTNYIHPWKTNYSIASLNLECAPCFYYSPKPLTCSRNDVQFKCIKELSVDTVYEKAAALIGNLNQV